MKRRGFIPRLLFYFCSHSFNLFSTSCILLQRSINLLSLSSENTKNKVILIIEPIILTRSELLITPNENGTTHNGNVIIASIETIMLNAIVQLYLILVIVLLVLGFNLFTLLTIRDYRECFR